MNVLLTSMTFALRFCVPSLLNNFVPGSANAIYQVISSIFMCEIKLKTKVAATLSTLALTHIFTLLVTSRMSNKELVSAQLLLHYADTKKSTLFVFLLVSVALLCCLTCPHTFLWPVTSTKPQEQCAQGLQRTNLQQQYVCLCVCAHATG